ncbi:MAG TPA: FUSC family protein [Mycobacteriales bacterium]|nr:FUSC family protein [Mycobacteriales bacterium]
MAVPAWLTRSLAFNRSGLRPAAGIRAGVGVLVPLAIGSAAGHPAEGAQAAAGALPVGVAAMTGAFGPPTALMLATTVGMTVSTFAGSLVAGHPVATVLALAVWGFAAGILVALGRAATVVGVQAVVAFIVFGRYPGGVSLSAVHAAWVLAGAAVQIGCAHLLRMPQRFGRERRAVAAAYGSLAVFARGVLDGASGAAAAEAIAESAALVASRSDDGGGAVDDLRGVVDEAARVRLELQSFATVPETATLRRLLIGVGDWLADVSSAIRQGDEPSEEPVAVAACVEELRARRATTHERFVAARASALLGQLRAVQRLATVLAGGRQLPLPRIAGFRPTLNLTSRVGSTSRRLRLAMDPRSSEMRHAIRLAALLAVAAVVSDVLPWQRGYWVMLTTLVVLKPDYAATMQRGIARVVGTGVGVVLAGLLVGALHPHDAELTALVGLFAAASYAVFGASYAVYTFLLTAVVVLLVSTFDARPLAAVADRGLDTLVGGALALGGYALWPTREAPTLRATTVALLDALATYADAVLGAFAEPSTVDHAQLSALARAARRCRADTLASLDRAAAEPARRRPDVEEAASLLASARRIVLTLHSLRATVQDSAEDVPVPELLALRHDIVEALRAAARRDVVRTPDLRESQHRLEEAADRSDISTMHGRRLALAAAHLDPLVDSVHTIEHVLVGGP